VKINCQYLGIRRENLSREKKLLILEGKLPGFSKPSYDLDGKSLYVKGFGATAVQK